MKYQVSWKPVDSNNKSIKEYGTMMHEVDIGRKLTFKDVWEVHKRDGHYVQLLEESDDLIRFIDANFGKVMTYKLIEE